MITDFQKWRKMVKPSWNIPLCEKVGLYMIGPVDVDNANNPILAKSIRTTSYKHAFHMLKTVKILYNSVMVESVLIIKNQKKPRKVGYMIRGVW